ncbi:hypothetical protein L9F63_023123, partial [Diploptera punctata]
DSVYYPSVVYSQFLPDSCWNGSGRFIYAYSCILIKYNMFTLKIIFFLFSFLLTKSIFNRLNKYIFFALGPINLVLGYLAVGSNSLFQAYSFYVIYFVLRSLLGTNTPAQRQNEVSYALFVEESLRRIT